MPSGGGGKKVTFGTWIGVGFLFGHRDNLGHDEYRLADVGVPGLLHPYRGLGDVVQEAAHPIGDGPFVRCQLPRVLGVLPEVLADRLLQGQEATHHLKLAGPPSRRVMFRKEDRGQSWGVGGVGAGGAEDGGVDFSIPDISIFLFMRWKSNEAKGTPDVKHYYLQ